MANLSEILEMLEQGVMEKKASKEEVAEPETPAGVEEITKSASAKKEAEDLGAQVASELLKQAGTPPWLKKDDEKSEDDKEEKKDDEGKKEESESDDDKSEDEDKKEDNKEENMDKKASLVDVITAMLEKSALEGDANTAAGIPEGVVPNKAQVDSAAMVADQDAIVGVTPGTDGNSQGGTVNQILDAIVAKAQGQGAVNPDQTADGHASAGAERQDDDVEKSAAVSALVEAGVDFDSAVDLVKQAEVELQAEAFEVEKKAAFDALVEAGIDFDDAASLVKEASDEIEKQALSFAALGGKLKGMAGTAKDKAVAGYNRASGAVKGYASKVRADASALPDQLANVKNAVKANKGVFNAGTGSTLKAVAKNRAVQLGAGTTAAAGAAGYAATRGREKRAAFDALVAEGIDFNTAVQAVQEADAEIYGE